MATKPYATALPLAIARSGIDYFVHVDCIVTPGEPCVPYYPDGSGYPGSDSSIEVTGCDVIEAEYTCACRDGGSGYMEYIKFSDRPDWKSFADRVILAELQGGGYDDELFSGLDNSEDDYCDD